VRHAVVVVIALVVAGCTTLTYTSSKAPEAVSECIASGWKVVANSGAEVPVSLTKTDQYYLVDVVLVRDLPTRISMHSTWAKVRPSANGSSAGSSTEYRRNFQIWHEKIDRVVRECQ